MSIGAIKIAKLYPDAIIPKRKSDGAVGFDACAHNIQSRDEERRMTNNLEKPVTIDPSDALLFGIGVVIELPMGYEIQVRPRSGLANIFDMELSNSPGTVDPDFRGEVGILLRNRGKKQFEVKKGMRIAQLIFSPVEIPAFLEVPLSKLSKTKRGEGGFGSTQLFGDGFGTIGYELEIARLDRHFMRMVISASELSDCIRGCKFTDGKVEKDSEGRFIGQQRRFGCVIARGLNVVSTGFNCQYPGAEKCANVGCLRDALKIPSGEQIEKCRAIHAEQMAIILATGSGISIKGATMYVNAEPCAFCARMIAGLKLAGLEALVILKGQYPNNQLDLVRNAGIIVREVIM